MPANPPKKAMMTSNIVGRVRANSSDCASLNGETRKYSVEVTKLMATMIRKLRNDRLSNSSSNVPMESPTPKMGPIIGEINMAPIITGIELTFSPTEAITIATNKMYMFGPRKGMFLRMFSSAACTSI